MHDGAQAPRVTVGSVGDGAQTSPSAMHDGAQAPRAAPGAAAVSFKTFVSASWSRTDRICTTGPDHTEPGRAADAGMGAGVWADPTVGPGMRAPRHIMQAVRTADLDLAELARLETLDDSPPTPIVPGLTYGSRFAESRFSPNYAHGVQVARDAVRVDELSRRAAHVWLDDDDEEPPPFDETFDIPPVAFCAGEFPGGTEAWAARAAPAPLGTDPRLIPPPNVGAARQRPDYMAPHGWHSAMAKEVRRVEGFKAWKLVRFREYQAARRRFPGRASIGAHV